LEVFIAVGEYATLETLFVPFEGGVQKMIQQIFTPLPHMG
jgi:hypothetical protein